jgi:hypothetical protein
LSTEVRIVKPAESSFRKKNIPVCITWREEPLIRNHSIRSTVDEVLKMSETLDVVKINIIGNPSTGKTTCAEVISHLVHKMSEQRNGIPYAVKFFDKNDLLNIKETIASLSPTNYCLVFDDLSFLASIAGKKKLEVVKQAFTEIRHLEGGQDIKVIAIFNFHYTRGLDKYLRNSEFSYYTSIGSEEYENMQQIVGNKNSYKLDHFKKLWQQAYTKGKFVYMLGKKPFVYPMRKPFAPLLFWNNQSLRFIVSPKRDWIDSICHICADTPKSKETEMNLDEFVEDFKRKHTDGTAKSALKIKLMQAGIITYSKRTVQAMRFIDQSLAKHEINLEDLAIKFGLSKTNTNLMPSKQPEVTA